MCRLAAFPPYYPPAAADYIIREMIGCNRDGVGTCWVEHGRFKARKGAFAYTSAKDPKNDFFGHMPCKSWTLAHVRAASIGKIALRNTHPFFYKDFAVVHNGTWFSHDIVRAALRGEHRFHGETDSEVGGYLIDKLGPLEFFNSISSGVWLALKRNGKLYAVKNAGDLEWLETENGVVLSSHFEGFVPSKYAKEGVWKYNKDGSYNKGWERVKPETPKGWERGWPKDAHETTGVHTNAPTPNECGELYYPDNKEFLDYCKSKGIHYGGE